MTETLYKLDDFVPSLRHELESRPLDFTKLVRVAVRIKGPNDPSVPPDWNRHELILTDGKGFCNWDVESIRLLFRGDKQPPYLGSHPEFYNDAFALFDLHVVEISSLFGLRRDAEMLEIYSTLRRRPDGRGLGFFFDYMWQAAALILGTRILSQAEYEAILSRLERSCRTFCTSPGSHNYALNMCNLYSGKGKQIGI
jgi:hypothetical protein